jgi:hypothetical protein
MSTREAMNIIELQRESAQEAMDAIYGKGYTPSDHDIEMMVEFSCILKAKENAIRNECMKEATEKRGVEW